MSVNSDDEFGGDDWRGEDSEKEQPDSDNNTSDDEEYQTVEEQESKGKLSVFEDSDQDIDIEQEEAKILANSMSWKENLAQKARDSFLLRHSEAKNIMRLVYGCYSQSESKVIFNFLNK